MKHFSIALIIGFCSAAAFGQPHIFWISDPVRPDETVMLQGSDLGGAAAAVEIARLEDQPVSDPSPAPVIKHWEHVPVLQGSDEALKFIIPAQWKMGVFACRVTVGGATGESVLINAPDPWWAQGDEGETATAGGWLRVMGKSLAVGGHSLVRLQPDKGEMLTVQPAMADDYSLRFDLPHDLKPQEYGIAVHNGSGGGAAWRNVGKIQINAAPAPVDKVFNVLETYGPDAVRDMRNTLSKYVQPPDRTEGIHAALKKAKENGGGIVYFPAGRYAVNGQIEVPDHTILKGEGTGLVTIWWGSGHFNLDGGGPQGRAKVQEPKPPSMMIFGRDYGIEDLSLYVPMDYVEGVVSDGHLCMRRVRVRIDHSWLLEGRGEGNLVRAGRNFQITDCDLFAKGVAVVCRDWGLVARNRILAMKSNTQLGGGRQLIVEENQFISMDPTAYQNIAGSGRNIYYGHNHHEALYAHQSDYSFTFDASGGAYLGGISKTDRTHVTLAADPTYPNWVPEKSSWWLRAAIFVLDGRGAGQWRDVTANHGRSWEIDRPFDTPPDASSVVTIVPFNGRALIVGNHFEDASWVNAGYGTSIDVICAGNDCLRSSEMMNYGVYTDEWYEPSWHVQYLDNLIREGQTNSGSLGMRPSQHYGGPLTAWAVHRRQKYDKDNSGQICIKGNIRDVIVEDCTLGNPLSSIRVEAEARGVVVRNNRFEAPALPRYEGDGWKDAILLPPPAAKK